MGIHVVTGANRGLGLEFAKQLKDRGDEVIATARSPEGASELASLGVAVHPMDVSDPRSIEAFAADLGERPVEVLINNAGMGVGGADFEHENWDDVARFFTVNSIGPMRVTRALLPNLRAGTKKTVANITSRMGSIDDNTSGRAYGYRASKAALNMMTKSMALDLEDEGITAVVLHPGWVATAMGGSAAPLTPEQSVSNMLMVIANLTPEDSGRFINHDGEPINW